MSLAATWARDERESSINSGSSATSTAHPVLNEQQAHTVDRITWQARLLDDYHLARERAVQVGASIAISSELLRMVHTGTAGINKIVVINEMLRIIGEERFNSMAPTGNAACGIRGQVHSFLLSPPHFLQLTHYILSLYQMF